MHKNFFLNSSTIEMAPGYDPRRTPMPSETPRWIVAAVEDLFRAGLVDSRAYCETIAAIIAKHAPKYQQSCENLVVGTAITDSIPGPNRPGEHLSWLKIGTGSVSSTRNETVADPESDCAECKNKRTYQPLLGPAIPCPTCRPA